MSVLRIGITKKPPDVKKIVTHKSKECSLDAPAAQWERVADALDGEFNG